MRSPCGIEIKKFNSYNSKATIKQRCKNSNHVSLTHLLDVVVKAPSCKVGNVVVLTDSLRVLVKEREITKQGSQTCQPLTSHPLTPQDPSDRSQSLEQLNKTEPRRNLRSGAKIPGYMLCWGQFTKNMFLHSTALLFHFFLCKHVVDGRFSFVTMVCN